MLYMSIVGSMNWLPHEGARASKRDPANTPEALK